MRHSLRANPALAALILFGVLLLPGFALADQPFNCRSCHKDLVRGKVAHKPVAAGHCLKCHQQLSYNHPLGKGSMGFIVPKGELCAVCHGGLLKKKFIHRPVARGECTACHLPHVSEHKALLKDPPPVLCFGCHPKERFTGSHTHSPVANGECLACHDPHQSDGKSLLRKPGSSLCFECHDAGLAAGKSVHEPVAKGDCVLCHAPHGSAYRNILKADSPAELYRPFGADAFPLCFSCHNPELVTASDTEKATNFRNGTRNLHAVHVNKTVKGRACKICHNPHTSAQDHLINRKAPAFGSWQIPIRYSATATGGGCSVGCHKTFLYDRVKAVVQ